MKTALCSLGVLALGLAAPLGCDHRTTNPIVTQPCAQMGFVYNDAGEITGNQYEFQPVGVDPDGAKRATGTFELNADGEEVYIGAGSLIADDDDLLDDYRPWQEAVALAKRIMAGDQETLVDSGFADADGVLPSATEARELIRTYANIDPKANEGDYSDEEVAAVEFVAKMVEALLPLCGRLDEPAATGVGPRPGDDLTHGSWPTFTACKDHYAANGDGVVGFFDLLREGHAEQDAIPASCPSSDDGANARALNAWGPLTTSKNAAADLPDVVDGFTYSGLTVPLEQSLWRRTMDRSEWEGVAFWARLSNASEAVPIPESEEDIPEGARPQDGVGQVGIIVQTIDTGATYNSRLPQQGELEMDFMHAIGVCEDGAAPTGSTVTDLEDRFCFETQKEFDDFEGLSVPENDHLKYGYIDENNKPALPSRSPYCLDYSPIDALPGEETEYRDQCWDGFRTMVDVTPEWKFYFLPFSEMRQAGWGRVGESFRTDQLRSVNILTSAYQPVNIMVDEISYYRKKGTGVSN